MESVPLRVFFMVLGAASLHATWNFFARKVKGNIAVIYLSLFTAVLLWLPAVIFISPKFAAATTIFPLFSWKGAVVTISTGLIHAIYFIFLGIAYRHGEISVVYPIARGTGVGLTSIIAYIFLGERAAVLGVLGIIIIVIGILAIGLKWELFSKLNWRKHYFSVELQDVTLNNSNNSLNTNNPLTESEIEISTNVPEDVLPLTETLSNYNQDSESEIQLKKNYLQSLIYALLVGVCICMYSVVDKIGVSIIDIDPITYAFFLALFAAIGMTPYMLWKYKLECIDAIKNLKPYIASVGPLTLLSYTIILFAYQDTGVSYIIALREVSVVIGAIFGFILLKEKITLTKIVGIILILLGLILVKLS